MAALADQFDMDTDAASDSDSDPAIVTEPAVCMPEEGDRVRVTCDADGTPAPYEGIITEVNVSDRKVRVHYDDNDLHWEPGTGTRHPVLGSIEVILTAAVSTGAVGSSDFDVASVGGGATPAGGTHAPVALGEAADITGAAADITGAAEAAAADAAAATATAAEAPRSRPARERKRKSPNEAPGSNGEPQFATSAKR